MTAKDQLSSLQLQLQAKLARRGELTIELEQVDQDIKAFRNAIEGARIGADALRESAAEKIAADKAAADAAAAAAATPEPPAPLEAPAAPSAEA